MHNFTLMFQFNYSVFDMFRTSKCSSFKKPCTCSFMVLLLCSGVPRGEGVGVFKPPPPEIPKALQNRAKLNPTVKAVKNC